MGPMLPGAAPADQATHTHKIVDGDTLPALAERYLGAASRAREIFDANRDLLLDPELLPIGVELKIPPRGNRPEPAPSSPPLTPVPHQ
jgi:nucleoid-associated protein YgaU